jgi:hypothetical protein
MFKQMSINGHHDHASTEASSEITKSLYALYVILLKQGMPEE